MGFLMNLLMSSIALSVAPQTAGADTPEGAIEGWQKALREKKWEAAYDWQAPSERQRLEKEFREKKIANVDEVVQLLGVSKEELFKLTPREFYVRMSRKLDEVEPGYFSVMANGKMEKKGKGGADWVFEYREKGQRENIPTTTSITLHATQEGGKWYVHPSKGAERASNEANVVGTLKSLALAETDFKTEDRDGDGKKNYWVGDVRGLFTLKGKDGTAIRLIEKETASADGATSKSSPELGELKTAPKAGYLFASLKTFRKNGKSSTSDEGSGRNESRFAFAAYPEKYGAGGKWTFIISEEGTVWRKDTSGKLPDGFPEDPKREGWEPVEWAGPK